MTGAAVYYVDAWPALKPNDRQRAVLAELISSLPLSRMRRGEEVQPAVPMPKRRRTRKPSLVSVAKQAEKAGLEVARYEIDTDGKISIVTGKPDIANPDQPNEWDSVLQ